MADRTPKNTNQLMRHLRANGVNIGGSSEKQKLRNIGYYHGYKGYRFYGSSKHRLPITDFAQILLLSDFDMQLKSLLYPYVMKIETALKSRTLEVTMDDARSSSFDDLFDRTLIAYRFARKPGEYKDLWLRRQRLKRDVDSLILDHRDDKPVIRHFRDKDEDIPAWALLEVMTLGNYGQFYECLRPEVKTRIMRDLGIPRRFDATVLFGKLVFRLTGLRNAIAHDGVIFDARFQNGKPPKGVVEFFVSIMGVNNVDLTSISDYVVLLVYLLRSLGFSKTECRQLVRGYEHAIERVSGQDPAIAAEVVNNKTSYQVQATVRFIKDS